MDTTLLESLPGNVSTFKQAESINNRTEKRDNNVAHESLGQYDFEKSNSISMLLLKLKHHFKSAEEMKRFRVMQLCGELWSRVMF